jgi:hypothetical protein
MKLFLSASAVLFLFGCATDPLMTGKPQDWQGHPSSELRMSWGEPTKSFHKEDGSEVWEYRKVGGTVIPRQDNTQFGFGGNRFGGSGQVNTVHEPERVAEFENVFRFTVKGGKVTKWYAARYVDGRVVWEDH